jgi:cell division protease FtsH
MKKNISSLYTALVAKRNILEAARTQLKKEFIGLDKVIDQLIDLSSTWYLFPDLQERPAVISLWGLTGTGKTSLVKRFSQLIDFENKYFRIDMKSNKSSLGLDDIDEINRISGENYMMLGLDEFQNIPSAKNAPEGLWDLLDSGLLEYNVYSRAYFRVHNIRQKLDDALRHGVVVKRGRVLEGTAIYKKIVDDDFDLLIREEKVWFFPPHYYSDICDLAPAAFPFEWNIRDALVRIDGIQTIQFLDLILKEFEKPKILDCSHSLIFVMGNLDEAYTMAKDFNPDLNADEFHALSLKITISHIKNALLDLEFRSEQISRLGNNHIIYPSFSRKSYQLIILKELERIRSNFHQKYGIQLVYDPSLLDLIYKEGVYPTQGTRPVISTINQILTSKLGIIVSQLVLKKLNCPKVMMSADGDKIIIQYLKGNTIQHTFEITQQLNLESLRKNRCDDMQAISAVHESGHTVLSMILLHTVPNAIYSVTAEAGMGGFIHSRMNWEYISRSQVMLQLAMMLGGYAAERFVFGNDNLTAGSESDLQRATGFASHMLKSCGMGNTHYFYQVASPLTNYTVLDRNQQVNDEVRTLLNEALILAENTLKEQERLLLQMADYLSDNCSMPENIAREMLANYASGNKPAGIIDNGDLLYYREALKNQLKTLDGQVSMPENIRQLSSITLNMGNQLGCSNFE